MSTLTNNLPNIDNVLIAGDTLCFTSTEYTGTHSLIYNTRLFTVDISNLNDLNVVEMTNYSVPSTPTGDYAGGVLITAIQTDNQGNLWVAESYDYTTFNFPDGFDLDDAELDEVWKHVSNHETYDVVRKLNSSGAEVSRIDISEVANDINWQGVSALNICDEGNVIVGSWRTIIVFDVSGDKLFDLETTSVIFQRGIQKLGDGTIAVVLFSATTKEVHILDIQNKSWGEEYILPDDTINVHSGNYENSIFHCDFNFLYISDFSAGETAKTLDLTEFRVIPHTIGNLLYATDEYILLTHHVPLTLQHENPDEFEIMITVLSLIEQSELPEVITLTLAKFGLDNIITRAVAQFNETNIFYRIEVVNYVNMRGDIRPTMFEEARQQFVLDVLAGKAPDIIMLEDNMYEDLVRSGVFEDLYKYIDNDVELNRSRLMEDILQKAEVDGALYHAFPFFGISTEFGHSDDVGSTPNWNFSEFKEVIESNPQARFPIGKDPFFESFLEFFFSANDFIDWDNGSAYFDTIEFIEILKFMKAFYSEEMLDVEHDRSKAQRISTGDQILLRQAITTFADYKVIQHILDNEGINKGKPRERISGSNIIHNESIAISAISENKEGAWEFVRMFLTEEWQQQNININYCRFPTNKTVFDRSMQNSMTSDGLRSRYEMALDFGIDYEPLTPEDVAAVLALIESAEFPPPYNYEPLNNIIYEGIHDFMNGLATAEDTARIIQSRASRFVSERHG